MVNPKTMLAHCFLTDLLSGRVVGARIVSHRAFFMDNPKTAAVASVF
jgi:hypothetical protein